MDKNEIEGRSSNRTERGKTHVTRREFLKTGLGSAALLALSGAGLTTAIQGCTETGVRRPGGKD